MEFEQLHLKTVELLAGKVGECGLPAFDTEHENQGSRKIILKSKGHFCNILTISEEIYNCNFLFTLSK